MTIHHDKLAYGKLASSREELTEEELLAMLKELEKPETDEEEKENKKTERNSRPIMKTDIYEKRVKENVVAEMLSFMSEGDCGYSKKDVAKCESLLLEYLCQLSKLENATDELIMAQVKKLVLALNKLNDKTDYCLIETDAREEICQIIQDSAVECGLSSPVEDVTEEWREW